MSVPKRIRPKGSESTYILESISPNMKGERVKFQDQTYVKEELPAEYVMFEGVAFKRGMRLDDYNKKAMMESASGKAPKKIRLRGTNIVLESIDDSTGNHNEAIKQIENAIELIQSAGDNISGFGFGDPRAKIYEAARKALYDLLEAAKQYKGA
jgi:hypothetical protein